MFCVVLSVDSPLVSVVIPTYNSDDCLSLCLSSLERQVYPNIEVIVVDNNSSDLTCSIAKSFGVRFYRFPGGMSASRNEGIKRARGRYIFSVDSDMELSPGLVDECVGVMEDSSLGGLVVPERSVGDSFWTDARDFERSFYSGSVVESARFFRLDVVREVGGYDDGLTFFEDSALHRRVESAGYLIGRVESEIFHHEDSFSIFDWLCKKYSYGLSARRYIDSYGDGVYVKSQVSPFNRLAMFLSCPGKFFGSPVMALGVLVLKFLEYMSVFLGILSSFLVGDDG